MGFCEKDKRLNISDRHRDGNAQRNSWRRNDYFDIPNKSQIPNKVSKTIFETVITTNSLIVLLLRTTVLQVLGISTIVESKRK